MRSRDGSESKQPPAWSRIGRLELAGLIHLHSDDECFYYLERSHGSYDASYANNMVNNFQKDLERFHDRPDVLAYKDNAIRFFAEKLDELLPEVSPSDPWVIVPAITSKPKSHPWHDDRLRRTAMELKVRRPDDVIVHDILDVGGELEKSKSGGSRDPHYLGQRILVQSPICPHVTGVILIDDVIASGGHFSACKAALKPVYPNAVINGAFLARQTSNVDYGIERL